MAIQSSGQILTGIAAKDIDAAIVLSKDADGFNKYAYKALALDTAAQDLYDVKGVYVKIADKDTTPADFLGVVGSDTWPQNRNAHPSVSDAGIPVLNTENPVFKYANDYPVKAGMRIPIERNGMLSVLAGTGGVKEGDLVKPGDNGTFVKAADKETSVGRAYFTAEEGERFEGYIVAL